MDWKTEEQSEEREQACEGREMERGGAGQGGVLAGQDESWKVTRTHTRARTHTQTLNICRLHICGNARFIIRNFKKEETQRSVSMIQYSQDTG